jgi:hypothetical protein
MRIRSPNWVVVDVLFLKILILQAWVMDNMELEERSILVLSNNFRHHRNSLKVLLPLLRIHDILVRIWIRTLPVPLTNGSGSCFFRQWPLKWQLKIILLITLCSYIYIIFQKYNVINKSQNSRNQGFSFYFCLMKEGSGFIPRTNRSGSTTLSSVYGIIISLLQRFSRKLKLLLAVQYRTSTYPHTLII